MDLGIKGKTALVLGAGGGLGSAIAEALASEGVNLALADMNTEALEATRQRVEVKGVSAIAIKWNLGDIDSIDQHVSHIESHLGEVDILVNNTGGPPPSPASGQEAELWQKHFNDMVLSVIGITDRVLPGMRKKSWGRVITSTSSGVISPIPNLGLSNALRSTLLGWSKTLSKELGEANITSNIVLPGRIATARTQFLDTKKAERENRDVDTVSRESAASIPLKRYGKPEEYGDVVAFLASERAAYISGSVVRVDGGMIASI